MSETMQCDGWRRYGGAFTIGPAKWQRCKGRPVVVMRVIQDEKPKTVNACLECWGEALDNEDIKIESSEPIKKPEEKTP